MSEPDEQLPPTHQAYGRRGQEQVAPSQGLTGYPGPTDGAGDQGTTQPYPQMFAAPATAPQPYAQPSYGQPSYGQPSYGQPGYPQPGLGQPGYPAGSGWGTAYAMAPTDGTATAAMVTGIVSIALAFFSCGVGLLGSPVALVLGIVAKRRIGRSSTPASNAGQATAGIILGAIGTVLLVAAVVVVVLFVIGLSHGPSHDDFGSVNA